MTEAKPVGEKDDSISSEDKGEKKTFSLFDSCDSSPLSSGMSRPLRPSSSSSSESGEPAAIKAAQEIATIAKTLRPMLEARREYLRHQSFAESLMNRQRVKASLPTHLQHGLDALRPSDLVNDNLGRLVTLVNTPFTIEQRDAIFNHLSELGISLDEIRELSNRSEEQMERSALELIFDSFKEDKRPKLCETSLVQDKIDAIQKLVRDLPAAFKAENTDHMGHPFPYVRNYVPLILNELRMFDAASVGDFHYRTVSYQTEKGCQSTAKIPHLEDKTITFVGAGFPLSGLMHHVYTGANVTLVDMDKKACEDAQYFLDICHDCGIVDKSKFTIVHGNALDFDYSGKSKEAKRNHVQTDVLHLASALPSDVKREVIARINAEKTGHVHVIDRYVSGLGKLLYSSKVSRSDLEKLQDKRAETLVKMYPESRLPKRSIDRKPEQPYVVTDAININSSRLLKVSER